MRQTREPTREVLDQFKYENDKLYRNIRGKWLVTPCTMPKKEKGLCRVTVDGNVYAYIAIVWCLHDNHISPNSRLRNIDGKRLNCKIDNIELVEISEKGPITPSNIRKPPPTDNKEDRRVLYKGSMVTIDAKCLFCHKCKFIQPAIPLVTQEAVCKLFRKPLFTLINEPTRCRECSEEEISRDIYE